MTSQSLLNFKYKILVMSYIYITNQLKRTLKSSVSSLEKMKVFAIFLYIAISCVFGELERYKSAKKNLKVIKDVVKVGTRVSHDDAKQTSSPDETLREKYAKRNGFAHIAASAKDADSVKKKALTNLHPVILTSTVKPSSSKVIKNSEIVYLEKSAHYSKALLKGNHPNITRPEGAKRISTDFLKSFLRHKDSVSRQEKNLTSNIGNFLRLKRNVARVPWHVHTLESYREFFTIRQNLPLSVRIQIRKTDDAEEKLIDKYATGKSVPSNVFADYNTSKFAEREVLKEEVLKAGSEGENLINEYKTLRDGRPWPYVKSRVKFKEFFEKPSAALTEYETLKQDELSSIDSYLRGPPRSNAPKAEEDTRMVRAKISKRAQTQEEDETADKMERGMRAVGIETVEAGRGVHKESAEDVVARIYESQRDIEIYRSHDNVTTMATTDPTEAKDNRILLRFAIVFTLALQGIIAILVLGPQSDKLLAWFNSTKRAEANAAETDVLHAGNKFLLLERRPKSRSLFSTVP